MLFSAIKSNVRDNLNDAAVINYSSTDVDESTQDAYDDIISQTQCIIKKVTLNWTGDLSYYDLITLVSDYLACVAIFNNVNNRWLYDDKTLTHFDLIRDDWEIAHGTPESWAALNHKYIAIFPKYAVTSGTFDLYYWAIAPTVVDANTPLIATDFQHLLEKFTTADLLEQFEEYTKAANFWETYITEIEQFKERTKNIAGRDLLIII